MHAILWTATHDMSNHHRIHLLYTDTSQQGRTIRSRKATVPSAQSVQRIGVSKKIHGCMDGSQPLLGDAYSTSKHKLNSGVRSYSAVGDDKNSARSPDETVPLSPGSLSTPSLCHYLNRRNAATNGVD